MRGLRKGIKKIMHDRTTASTLAVGQRTQRHVVFVHLHCRNSVNFKLQHYWSLRLPFYKSILNFL